MHPLFPGGVFRVQYTVQYLKPPPPFFTIAENVIHYCSVVQPGPTISQACEVQLYNAGMGQQEN